MTDEERRQLGDSPRRCVNSARNGLAPGVVSELAAGVLALIEHEQHAPTGVASPVSPHAETPELPWRAHDHTAEEAVTRAFENPAPENQHQAERAVALLQRRFDHVLRRLDGAGEVTPYPVHQHDPSENPAGCLHAVLHELAGVVLADRAETLAHWLAATHALERQAAEARAFARGYEHGLFEDVDTDALPAWLSAPLSTDNPRDS